MSVKPKVGLVEFMYILALPELEVEVILVAVIAPLEIVPMFVRFLDESITVVPSCLSPT